MRTQDLMTVLNTVGSLDSAETTRKVLLYKRAMDIKHRMQKHSSLLAERKKKLEESYKVIAERMSPDLPEEQKAVILAEAKDAYKKISDADEVHQKRSKKYFDKVGFSLFTVIEVLEFLGRVK